MFKVLNAVSNSWVAPNKIKIKKNKKKYPSDIIQKIDIGKATSAVKILF